MDILQIRIWSRMWDDARINTNSPHQFPESVVTCSLPTTMRSELPGSKTSSPCYYSGSLDVSG